MGRVWHISLCQAASDPLFPRHSFAYLISQCAELTIFQAAWWNRAGNCSKLKLSHFARRFSCGDTCAQRQNHSFAKGSETECLTDWQDNSCQNTTIPFPCLLDQELDNCSAPAIPAGLEEREKNQPFNPQLHSSETNLTNNVNWQPLQYRKQNTLIA